MKFINEYPKKEITIEAIKTVGSLSINESCKIHYRNYLGYLDSVNHIILEGDKNTWFGIKHDFLYDTLMNTVKKEYIDVFNRSIKVSVIN
tara:strand:- start:278 stop:547 length:270 start_codon:yes stop_codon:yes gene_type:complete